MTNLKQIEPQEVFKWFYEINQIPRCSYDEKRVSDFLVDFAKERKLEVYQDELNNIIIKKGGTKGYENANPVIIQGHMDMVCVKGQDSDHDFTKDPIEMIVEGDFLRANDTTLGADDGIAVAYGLAILDSNDLKHPPLELLVTTNEESGMDGAHGLKNDHLSGKTLLNIDSEEEGILLVSCAGGASNITRFELEKEEQDEDGLEISISGLKGGHSGMEIVKQRANAIKLLGRILDNCRRSYDITLAKITGGTKHNAIPNSASACVLTQDRKDLKKLIEEFSKELKEEYRAEDEGLTIEISEVKIKKSYTKELSDNLMDYIIMSPDGVQYMSKDIEGLVQTSLNNAIIEEKEDAIEIITSVRSASSSSLQEVLNVLEIIARKSGGAIKETGRYPAWQYDENSKIRDKALEVYKNLFQKEAEVSAIHAGLECGLLKQILPDTDMLSFGPNIYDVHTQKEHISISSVERVWEFLVELLESLN
ncbi:aminoacyl-histidine dipeptidase [Tissierella creatinophila]|uniref:Cytosol non-specific dipeptidase n=1 Tax=Tissierella creatinophila DSM 6911 TaxID=1123403 RepID=A0A1U7M575_TISCR|nr:aminoacyl-histidine dipeptidase [Tissierella creatinophila]OLS02369.1 cytosol non-specific dipeptidase [Tissierella creatinophila DSM 6911]